jgi:hypothetical protein
MRKLYLLLYFPIKIVILKKSRFNNQYIKNDGTKEKFTFSSATAFFPAFTCFVVGTLRNILFSEGPSKLPLK